MTLCLANHVHDLVEVWVGSQVETSIYSAIFLDVALGQRIPHVVCRQQVYLKNSVHGKLVIGDVKRINCNELISFPCQVSTLNEALLLVIRNRVLNRTIVDRTRNKPCCDDQCVLAHHAK